MSAEGDVTVMFVNIKNVGIGQGVVLRLKATGLDGVKEIIDIRTRWFKSEGAKRIAM